MQKKKLAAAVLLATFIGAGTPLLADAAATANTNKTVIATVADQPIYKSQLDAMIKDMQAQFGNATTDQLEGVALSSLIDQALVDQAAKAEGLDKTPEFQQRMEMAFQQALYNEYYDEHIAGDITDDMVKARYEKEVAAMPKQEEIHARQILVSSEDKADEVIKKLDDGGDFEKLAEQYSTGPSAKSGGDLGYFTKGQMDPAFEKAAFALKPGQYTEKPIKTDTGYHVIEVVDVRDKAPVAFDQVAPQIRQLVARDQYMKQLATLKENGTVVIKDKDLKAAYDTVNKDSQS